MCDLPLIFTLNLSIPIYDVSSRVADLVDESGYWNTNYLKNIVSNDVLLKICSELPLILLMMLIKSIGCLKVMGSFLLKLPIVLGSNKCLMCLFMHWFGNWMFQKGLNC